MKKILIILVLCGFTINKATCQTGTNQNNYADISDLHPTDTLFRVCKGDYYELGIPSGYVNQNGDTIIPIGKYFYCFFDTITTFAIVADTGKINLDFYAIDKNKNRLYEVYWFDNGPDYIKEGLFRVLRNEKIGI